MEPETKPTLEIRKPDLQMLLQDQASNQRMLMEALRAAEKRLNEERELARWQMERMRVDLTEKNHDLQNQIEALVRTLGRIQDENDRLREDLAIARSTARLAIAVPPTPESARKLMAPKGSIPLVNPIENLEAPPAQLPPKIGGIKD